LCFSEQDRLCGGHTWPWAVRYHAAFDAPANAPQEFWHRRPIDLNSDGVIFCGHPRWKAAAKLGLARVPGYVAREQAVYQYVLENRFPNLHVTSHVLGTSRKPIGWGCRPNLPAASNCTPVRCYFHRGSPPACAAFFNRV
jgi:hypothetical protein